MDLPGIRSMRRFLAQSIEDDRVVLDRESSHHLLRVSGIAPGESVELVDGRGGHAEAVLVGSERGCACLELTRRLPVISPREHRVLVVSLLRAQVFDLVLRQATELGVDRIIPLQAERSIAKMGKPDRWERVVRAAMIQSGRALLPRVDSLCSLHELSERLPLDLEKVLLCPGGALLESSPSPIALLIGPEGGWSPKEQSLAADMGFRRAGLGPLTLRAETAASAALSRLLSVF
jgi:16S rRNA (uracil1498-N3)-methyltransferase